jgi:hypothetical protein
MRAVDPTHRSLSFMPSGVYYTALVDQFRQNVIGD